jgi:DNA-binding transcriptional LysR family regulator
MQVQALEDYLGLPVFHRRGRSVELTAEGARLLPDIEAGLRRIESALDAARGERGRKPLKVTMLASFLQQWLLPVCAPSLLERLGPALSAQDLARYPLLHASTEPWSAWCSEGATPATEEWAESGNTFDDSVAVIRAAEGGLGLALARWSLAEGALRAGTLVMASSRVVRSGRSYWFVCPPGYLRLRKVKDLRDWLVGQCAAMPLPPGVSRDAPAAALAQRSAPRRDLAAPRRARPPRRAATRTQAPASCPCARRASAP